MVLQGFEPGLTESQTAILTTVPQSLATINGVEIRPYYNFCQISLVSKVSKGSTELGTF